MNLKTSTTLAAILIGFAAAQAPATLVNISMNFDAPGDFTNNFHKIKGGDGENLKEITGADFRGAGINGSRGIGRTLAGTTDIAYMFLHPVASMNDTDTITVTFWWRMEDDTGDTRGKDGNPIYFGLSPRGPGSFDHQFAANAHSPYVMFIFNQNHTALGDFPAGTHRGRAEIYAISNGVLYRNGPGNPTQYQAIGDGDISNPANYSKWYKCTLRLIPNYTDEVILDPILNVEVQMDRYDANGTTLEQEAEFFQSFATVANPKIPWTTATDLTQADNLYFFFGGQNMLVRGNYAMDQWDQSAPGPAFVDADGDFVGAGIYGDPDDNDPTVPFAMPLQISISEDSGNLVITAPAAPNVLTRFQYSLNLTNWFNIPGTPNAPAVETPQMIQYTVPAGLFPDPYPTIQFRARKFYD